MGDFWKYDVAISFAAEDAGIAKKLNRSLKRHGLRVYFYQEKNQWSRELGGITQRNYYDHVSAGLILASKQYVKGNWSMKEYKLLTGALRDGNISKLFILRLDNVILPKAPGVGIYERWRNNPDHLARKMVKILSEDLMMPSRSLRLAVPLFLSGFFLMLVVLLYWL